LLIALIMIVLKQITYVNLCMSLSSVLYINTLVYFMIMLIVHIIIIISTICITIPYWH
jgi:hypothetical protein